MSVRNFFPKLIVLLLSATVVSASEAGFGDDGIGCLAEGQWAEATWDLFPNNDTVGFRTWVLSKSKLLNTKTTERPVRYVIFDKEIKLSNGQALKSNWRAKRALTERCLGGCGPNCDAEITFKNSKFRLWQVGSIDCLEHDLCVIMNRDHRNDRRAYQKSLDRNCADEWTESVDDHVTAAVNHASTFTPRFDYVDFANYFHCGVLWGF